MTSPSGPWRPPTGALLAVLAIALAVLAPFVGSPARPGADGVAELSEELASGAPLVDAVTVGEWIRDRRPLRLVDLRDSSSVIRLSIPTAQQAGFASLPGLAVDSGVPIVVYDDGGGASVRAWLLLRRLGHPRVHIMEGGILGWIEGVIDPVMPRDTPEERERYDRVAAVSRYFGGLPRVGRPPERGETSADDAVQLLSRRGCY